MVEPVGGILGAYAVMVMEPLLPYALAFAAGAMIFVVVDQLVRPLHAHLPFPFSSILGHSARNCCSRSPSQEDLGRIASALSASLVVL